MKTQKLNPYHADKVAKLNDLYNDKVMLSVRGTNQLDKPEIDMERLQTLSSLRAKLLLKVEDGVATDSDLKDIEKLNKQIKNLKKSK